MLFDGVCGLCSLSVRWILARDRRAAFRFAPLQGAAGQAAAAGLGLSRDLTTIVVIPNYHDPTSPALTRSRAALFVCRALGWPWKAAAIAGVLPAAWLDGVYDVIARHRYRLFGRRDECFVPRAEERDRFLD